jgi:hypothetical protein
LSEEMPVIDPNFTFMESHMRDLELKLKVQDEQIKFLLHQLSGCLMPTQWNAILKRLEEIKNESNS